jgi:hypothetical protein
VIGDELRQVQETALPELVEPRVRIDHRHEHPAMFGMARCERRQQQAVRAIADVAGIVAASPRWRGNVQARVGLLHDRAQPAGDRCIRSTGTDRSLGRIDGRRAVAAATRLVAGGLELGTADHDRSGGAVVWPTALGAREQGGPDRERHRHDRAHARPDDGSTTARQPSARVPDLDPDEVSTRGATPRGDAQRVVRQPAGQHDRPPRQRPRCPRTGRGAELAGLGQPRDATDPDDPEDRGVDHEGDRPIRDRRDGEQRPPRTPRPHPASRPGVVADLPRSI